MSERDHAAEARALIACLDLTELGDGRTEADVDALISRADGPHGKVAAICIWPRFVAHAKARLPEGIKLATVINFPDGGEDIAAVTEEVRAAIEAGADEIDTVIAWRLVEEDPGTVADHVAKVREAAEGVTLKAILETSELKDPAAIEMAAVAALKGGADFLKTSTGKAPGGASLPAARIMLRCIHQHEGGAVGLKPSGGIRTFEEALAYRDLADEVMGEGWATPRTFRIGASSLLADLQAVASGERRPAARDDY